MRKKDWEAHFGETSFVQGLAGDDGIEAVLQFLESAQVLSGGVEELRILDEGEGSRVLSSLENRTVGSLRVAGLASNL